MRAAACSSFVLVSVLGLIGLTSRATTFAVGTNLVQQLQPFRRYLDIQSGHARDIAARPIKAGNEVSCTGSPTVVKTIGIVVVAAFAARAAGVVVAAITVT